ncbi:SusC/RagA family TonB-linked outer membrane protein [Flagellimonas sp. HMM57]|uniref:SusC/RagA family TonB-linked outer membrane protein n=1 Tax=unclassified Flagellimonas TaxID=2644544 RepID=UPI0013D8B173|nr:MULTISPECIES: SusC/RagA family TonB-linked outer membrane protein [unclassified Flagellimonas]UII76475.1 SusC/RagA family TonB-linked outer membrane protein [Flagellimonas sp. HMM57]
MIQKITFKLLKIPRNTRISLNKVFLMIIMPLISQISLGNYKIEKIPTSETLFQSTISGTITDASGLALPGASIVEKGTTNGTQSDFDGNFTINVGADAVLVISYVGFLSQEITVGNNSTINVALQEDANQLDEVVITGYSAQSTRDITGSVSTIKSENIAATAPTGLEQALQGQASGVVVGSQGGPGGSAAVRIRGFGTINGNDPLYIIDGTPTGAGLNDLNPNDIESIQILKDASSAAIYGNRAANGVIIITTKGGKKNKKLSFTANTYVGVDFIPGSAFPDLASPQQIAESVWREFTNTGATPSNPQFGSGTSPTLPNFLIPQGASTADESSYDPSSRATSITRSNPQGTDWFNEYFNTAITQSYDINASAGTENSSFFASMSVLDQEGVGYESSFTRYTLRANSSFDITDKFRIGENITVSYSDQITPPGSDVNNGTVASLYRLHPLIPVRDVGGNFAGSGVGGLGNGNNPIAIADRNKDNDNLSFRALGNVYAEMDLIKGLTFKTNLGFDIFHFNQVYFQPPQLEGEIFNESTWLSERNDLSRTYTWFNTLNYSKAISNSIDLDVLVGTEFNKVNFRSTTVNRADFDVFTTDVRFFNNANGEWGGYGTGGRSAYFSLFGKADVKIKDKYLLSATIRRDETSLFNTNKRSGVFPSGSIGWRVSEEDFLKDSEILTNLLFKAGYGEVGNNGGIRTDARSTTLGPNVGNYNYPNSTTSSDPGVGIDLRGNPDIGWETTRTLNVGFTSRWANSINFDLDIYSSTTEDMLLAVPEDPTLLGNINIVPANLGEMENKGFDASIAYDNYQTDKAFQYNLGFNISAYRNEVKFLDPDNPDSFINGDDLRDQNPTRTLSGHPISSFFGNTWAGIENGRVVFDELDETGTPVRGVIGNPHPDFTYGLTFNGTYKNFDVSLLFQGSQGNDIYNFNKYFTDFNKFIGGRSLNYVNEVGLPAVTQDATIINREAAASTYYVEDGSYLRMKNIVIGYSLPQSIVEKLSLQKFRVYLQGKNLITLTNYTGLDPEISLRSFAGSVGPPSLTPPDRTDPGTNLTYGVDTGVYPINRSIIMGIMLTF